MVAGEEYYLCTSSRSAGEPIRLIEFIHHTDNKLSALHNLLCCFDGPQLNFELWRRANNLLLSIIHPPWERSTFDNTERSALQVSESTKTMLFSPMSAV